MSSTQGGTSCLLASWQVSKQFDAQWMTKCLPRNANYTVHSLRLKNIPYVWWHGGLSGSSGGCNLSYANVSQLAGIFPFICGPGEARNKRFQVWAMCVAARHEPPPNIHPPFSSGPPRLLSSSPVTPPSDPRGKLSLFAEIGMSIPAPLTQVCSSPPSYWGND